MNAKKSELKRMPILAIEPYVDSATNAVNLGSVDCDNRRSVPAMTTG